MFIEDAAQNFGSKIGKKIRVLLQILPVQVFFLRKIWVDMEMEEQFLQIKKIFMIKY